MRSIITSRVPRRAIPLAGLFFAAVGLQSLSTAQDSSGKATSESLPDVTRNAADEPRATPITRSVMKQYLEDLKQRVPRIPLPEISEEEKKAALEDPRAGTYEGRLRKLYLPESPTSSYLPFSGTSSNNRQAASRMGPPEPLLTLDYAFKVRLFWIAARANNCQYCLGHQESKLLAAGMNEDEIAALDSEWELFPENEQAAFALAKRLTLEPHRISDEDIDRCRPFYSDAQMIEMIGSIAGNNAINRWKEGAGIPQSTNGGGFGSAPGSSSSTNEEHSYLTATSDAFAKRRSKIVSVDPSDASLVQISRTKFQRAALESKEAVAMKLKEVQNRKSRLPLVDADRAAEVMGDTITGGRVEQWHRLLAHFPVAGKRFADGMRAASTSDMLDPSLQSQIDWVVARQDRAWYAAALAMDAMRVHGVTDAQIESLDQDFGSSIPGMQDRDRALLNVAQKLSASPIVLTDKDVADAIKLAGPKAVTQTINYTAYRAAFNRITEAAGLGK
ncbi:MAG: hypothetical protein ACK553_03615 [Planctomycetota bacterium]|jgi:alkylhydroperoxidase family enzyme